MSPGSISLQVTADLCRQLQHSAEERGETDPHTQTAMLAFVISCVEVAHLNDAKMKRLAAYLSLWSHEQVSGEELDLDPLVLEIQRYEAVRQPQAKERTE